VGVPNAAALSAGVDLSAERRAAVVLAAGEAVAQSRRAAVVDVVDGHVAPVTARVRRHLTRALDRA